jgi:hypothetical protein
VEGACGGTAGGREDESSGPGKTVSNLPGRANGPGHSISPPEVSEISGSGFPFRALFIGAIASLIACVVVAYSELVIKEIQIAICQFSPAAIGLLLLIVLGNKAFRLAARRIGLTARELMLIYMMILASALLSSRGIMEKLLPALVAANYYTTPENHWAEDFYPQIPQWMVPFDVKGAGQQPVSALFYEGVRQAPDIPWHAWLRPLSAWAIIVVAVLFSFMCMSAIMRRQWVDNEKLSFPLVQLPLDMVSEDRRVSFFSNKLTWIGFAIPAVIFTLNGLHANVPVIPQIPLEQPVSEHFKAKPWTDMYPVTIYCSFAAIGFAYFLPSQLLFSLWAFYVFSRLEDLVASSFGWRIEDMPLYPTRLHIGYQAAGAYVVLTAYYVRAAIPHFRAVWRKAWRADPTVDDRDEFLPYRVALFGLAIAVIVAVGWCMEAGMSAWMAIVEMGVYLFIVVVVMARSVSEAGMLMTETSFRPVDLVRMFTTKYSLGKTNLTILGFTDAVFTRDLRGCLMSTFLDGLKITDGVHMPRRHLLGGMSAAIVLALLAGVVIQLWLPYTIGALGMYSYPYWGNSLWALRDAAPALSMPDAHDWRLITNFCVGVLAAIGLSVARMRLWWWPLYPLGFALMGSWTMIVFWFPILVAWLIKGTIVRYSGMKTYAVLRPFFLGLILGEFFMAIVWATLGCIWRIPAPFFPWP